MAIISDIILSKIEAWQCKLLLKTELIEILTQNDIFLFMYLYIFYFSTMQAKMKLWILSAVFNTTFQILRVLWHMNIKIVIK